MKFVYFVCPKQVDPNLEGIRRKKTYETKEDAQAVADKNATPYLCNLCEKWHLTSSKRTRKV